MQNGQFRDTGNNGHKTQNKQNRNNTDPTNKLGVNPDPHRVVISQKQCAKMYRFFNKMTQYWSNTQQNITL